MARIDNRDIQIQNANALRILLPELELNLTSKYVSLDAGPLKSKPKNAVHLPFNGTYGSFYMPSETLRNKAESSGLILEASENPRKRRIAALVPSLIEKNPEIFREILVESATDVKSRPSGKVRK